MRAGLLLLALAMALAAVPARAQIGGSISLQSDARYRGYSLDQGRPQAQLSLGYDGPQGWYGGAWLATMRLDAQRRSPLLQAYAGRVVTLMPGLDGEAGLTLSRFSNGARYDYVEAYAGLLAERWRGRLSVSPDYFGLGRSSLYAELGTNWPLGPAVQAFAQLGALRGHVVTGRSTRLDLRAGAALRHEQWEFQLAWVAVGRGGPLAAPASTGAYYGGIYVGPPASKAQRNALVLGATLSF